MDSYKSSYELITAWLVLNGFVSEPVFYKGLYFQYETDIEQAYIDDNDFDKKSFLEAIAEIKKGN